MKQIIKIPFVRQKGTIATLCIVCTLSFIASGCGNSKMSDIENSYCDYMYDVFNAYNDYINENTSCENKTILKTFKDEPGFIRGSTDPIVDRTFYYFFEPLSPSNDFSEQLFLWLEAGTTPDRCLDKLVKDPNLVVTVSGNVTNCLFKIQRTDNGELLVDREYNVLELVTIKQ